MFYDRLNALCAERGLSISGLLVELEISPSSASRWKNKGFEPSRATLKKIADYFGITVHQLMQGENENAPAPKSEGINKSNIVDMNKEDESIQIIHRAAKKMTPENRKKLIDIVKVMFDEEFDDD